MVAFISAWVHVLPLANLAAHAEASATVTIAFLTIQINLKRAILIEREPHRFQRQSQSHGSPKFACGVACSKHCFHHQFGYGNHRSPRLLDTEGRHEVSLLRIAQIQQRKHHSFGCLVALQRWFEMLKLFELLFVK
ncbi:MAG: hypothetical protein [Circular genetic element sp.]|nr:MAG: hypothetical protein [Circular genetic element sp.]